MSETLNLDLNTKKQWMKALVLGLLIGLAVILPGISGATIAIIFGLYSKMIYSFGNIFKHFKKCFLFLLPIVIGVVIGVLIGFFFVQEIFETQPFIVICLFAGLMIGSFPAVKDEVRGIKWNTSKISIVSIGVLIPIAIGLVSIFLQTSSFEPIKASPTLMAMYFVMGFVLSLTQLIPGLSCSALLMAFGQFSAILASIHFDYLKNNPLVLLTLAFLAIGFLIGIVVFSKLLNKLFEKKRENTYTLIVGLSLGSIFTMFLNSDIYAVYTSWSSAGEIVLDLTIGAILLLVGVIISYLLVRYQRRANKNKTSLNEELTDSEDLNEKEKIQN